MAWAAIQALHIVFRRQALAQLVFPTLSRKRACLLVSEHVRGGPLSSPVEANAREPLWAPSSSMEPVMDLGCGLDHLIEGWKAHPLGEGLTIDVGGPPSSSGAKDSGMVKGEPSSSRTSSDAFDVGAGQGRMLDYYSGGRRNRAWKAVPLDVQLFVDLYREEQYMMSWWQGKARVCLKQGANQKAVLRALWQAAWLQAHHTPDKSTIGSVKSREPRDPLSQFDILRESLVQLNLNFGMFEDAALSRGWALDVVNIKGGVVRVALSTGWK